MYIEILPKLTLVFKNLRKFVEKLGEMKNIFTFIVIDHKRKVKLNLVFFNGSMNTFIEFIPETHAF